MDPRLTWQGLEAMVAERRRQADSARLAGVHGSSAPEGAHAAVTVRFASPEDARGLERLAELDSGYVPTGPVLVAEVDGQLVAALPVDRGRALADPFRPTTELVHLLELREAQLRGRSRRGRRSARFRRPGQRRAAPAQARP